MQKPNSISPKIEKMRQLLNEKLKPEYLEIIDETAKHQGHSGYMENGSHFFVRIKAETLNSLKRVAQHQAIYAALGTMMHQEIHALKIEIITNSTL